MNVRLLEIQITCLLRTHRFCVYLLLVWFGMLSIVSDQFLSTLRSPKLDRELKESHLESFDRPTGST